MEKIWLCFKAFFLGTTLYALTFSSKWIELLLSYLLISHAYKEGEKNRSITREPWLGRNKGHKEEFLRYRQLSKLSSAFACAAVFALCFLNLWITLYNRRKRVKTDFLQQRIQAVFLKRLPYSRRQVKQQKKPIPDQQKGQSPTWDYFDRLHQIKPLIGNSSIPTVSTVFV